MGASTADAVEEVRAELRATNARLAAAMTERMAATAARDLAVVTAYAAGMPVATIAADLAVRPPVVSRILTRALASTEETAP